MKDVRLRLMRWWSPTWRDWLGGLLLLWLACVAGVVHAETWTASVAARKPLNEWLERMRKAALDNRYTGTFVVSAPGGAMSSSRIWHAGDGKQQVERIESLSGPGKLTFRHNSDVLTLVPQQKLAFTERYVGLAATGTVAASSHRVSLQGDERVAGVDAWVLLVSANDKLRYSYRIWSEKSSGLVVKTETLDEGGHAVEQAGFSEVQLAAAVAMDQLLAEMRNTDGYRVMVGEWHVAAAKQQPWALSTMPQGFALVDCALRHGPPDVTRCRLSDGMATVSVFVEKFDPNRHLPESQRALGATHVVSRRAAGKGSEWWVTALGEVPMDTLLAIVAGLKAR